MSVWVHVASFRCLIPVLRISQRINHLYNEFSSHLRFQRFWDSFPEIFFFFNVSFMPGYFDKVGNSLHWDCLGSVFQRSVSVQTSWYSLLHRVVLFSFLNDGMKKSFREKCWVCQIKDSQRSSFKSYFEQLYKRVDDNYLMHDTAVAVTFLAFTAASSFCDSFTEIALYFMDLLCFAKWLSEY